MAFSGWYRGVLGYLAKAQLEEGTLPGNAAKFRHSVEMVVAAQHGQLVLARESGDPGVVRRARLSSEFQSSRIRAFGLEVSRPVFSWSARATSSRNGTLLGGDRFRMAKKGVVESRPQ